MATATRHNGSDPGLRDESFGALLKQLGDQTSTLVRQEIELARAELSERGKRAGAGAGMLGTAAVVGLLALGALTAAIIAALATGMDTWLAALIVAVAYGAVAGIAAVIGKNRVVEAVPPAPQTVETIKEDVSWAKTQTTSVRK